MKFVVLVLLFSFLGLGCSTVASFHIPKDTVLIVGNKKLSTSQVSYFKTTPYFWNSIAGIDYKLTDNSNNIIKQGSLKTGFRVLSIFWPPLAFLYWPVGFQSILYDIENPDGIYVTPTQRTFQNHKEL